jgi:hypothetical protein
VVPTGIATLHEDQRHGSHKADEDFSALLWDSADRIRVIYEFRPWNKLDGGAMEEESCFAMKGDSPQIGREDDDANVIFDGGWVLSIQEWSLHTAYTELWEISMCAQSSNCLKSKYLSIFSARRASRVPGTHVTALPYSGSISDLQYTTIQYNAASPHPLSVL